MSGMWHWCCCSENVVEYAVAWTDSLNGEVVLAEYVDNDWRYETIGTVGGYYTVKPRIVYDSKGKPYIAYCNEAGYSYLAYRNGD